MYEILIRNHLWEAHGCRPHNQSKSVKSQRVRLCMCPVSNLGFWPLQTLCCSPPVSLEVWCSLSQCRASSGASAAAAEPAPTQVQDLAETTYTALTQCKADYTNKGGKVAWWARNNYVQGPGRGKCLAWWSVLEQGNESLTAPGKVS